MSSKNGKTKTDEASPTQPVNDLVCVPLDAAKHRRDWLKRLAAELDKIEPLMPVKLLPDGVEYPQWVQNVEQEFSLVMFPVAKLKGPDVKMTPKRMGALLGHLCESAVWMKDWIESQFEFPDSPGEEPSTEITTNREAAKKGEELLKGLDIWYCAMRRLAKRALCSCVDQTYEDMTDFLLGYADAFSRKPKTFKASNIGNPTFEIYVFMLVYWQMINGMDSVRHLHETLVTVLGANRAGDQKRIEKICQRIGLSFRKPGRPKLLK